MAIQFPSDAINNTPYTDPGTGYIYDWDGQKWNGRVSSGAGSTPISVGDTPPSGATVGDLWWNSDDGRLYIYYNDGDTLQWVDASPPGAGSDGGGSGGIGSLQEVTDVGNTTTNWIRVGDFDSTSATNSGSVVDVGTLWAQRPYSATMGCLNIWGGTTETAIIYSDGGVSFGEGNFTINADGDVKIGGTLPASPNIELNANGSSNFEGKITTASTVAGDPGNTLVTKDFLSGADGIGGVDLQAVTDNGNTTTNGATFLGGTAKIDTIGGGRIVSGDGANDKPGITLVQNGALNVNTAVGAMTAITVRSGGTEKVSIGNDGSAGFASSVQVGTTGADTTNPGGFVYSTRWIDNDNRGSAALNGASLDGDLASLLVIDRSDGAGAETVVIKPDGSASFAGQVWSGGNPFNGADTSSKLTDVGVVVASATPNTNPVWLGYTTGTTTETSRIGADGSATFAGSVTSNGVTSNGIINSTGNLQLDSTGTFGSSSKASISAQDGSASFSSTVKSESPTGTFAALNPGYIVIQQPNTSSGDLVFRARNSVGNERIEFWGDGSANFAGQVIVGDPADDGNYFNLDEAVGSLTIVSNLVSGNILQYGRPGGAPLFRVTESGAANFSGSVSIGGTDAAHTIDEYEEGLWTPVLNNVSNSAGVTISIDSSVSSNSYTKIGNKVFVTCRMPLTSSDTNAQIAVGDRITLLASSLPFPIMGNCVMGTMITLIDAPAPVRGATFSCSESQLFFICNYKEGSASYAGNFDLTISYLTTP